MKVRGWLVAMVMIGGGLLSSVARAAEGQAPGSPQGAPEMDPAMMEKMMAMMMPGPPHEAFKFYLGNWTAKTKMWWMSEGEPVTSDATAKSEWLLDGRYMHTTFTSTMMGQPFTGHSFDGYDNQSGKYFSIWFDSMGTGYFLSEGTASADGKTITFKGSHVDPMTGQPASHTMVITQTGSDSYAMTMFETTKGQKERKVMEVAYTRN